MRSSRKERLSLVDMLPNRASEITTLAAYALTAVLIGCRPTNGSDHATLLVESGKDVYVAASAMPENKASVLALLMSPQSRKRLGALEVLSVCADSDCREAFARCLDDPDLNVRLMSMLCLTRYPVELTRPKIRELAGSRLATERSYALQALAKLGGDADVDVALAHVLDAHEAVAKQAFL